MRFTDETEADLKSLIEKDFGPLPAGADTRRTLVDWLHYRARRIPQRPRVVVLSPQAAGHCARYPAIDRIRAELMRGGDLSPWLSDRIRRRKADPKADLMFNDWQISHFHLGDFYEARNKIKRTTSGTLLFAHIKPDRAVLLDVQPHMSWTMTALLRILLDVSPADMPELKGIQGSRNRPLTDDQLFNLRSNGYTAPIEIGGKVFMSPGMGIAASQHATRLVHYSNALMRALQTVRRQLQTNTVPRVTLQQIGSTIGLPVRLGIRLHAGGLIIYEKTRRLDLVSFQSVA
jgi:hypothetical protein